MKNILYVIYRKNGRKVIAITDSKNILRIFMDQLKVIYRDSDDIDLELDLIDKKKKIKQIEEKFKNKTLTEYYNIVVPLDLYYRLEDEIEMKESHYYWSSLRTDILDKYENKPKKLDKKLREFDYDMSGLMSEVAFAYFKNII